MSTLASAPGPKCHPRPPHIPGTAETEWDSDDQLYASTAPQESLVEAVKELMFESRSMPFLTPS